MNNDEEHGEESPMQNFEELASKLFSPRKKDIEEPSEGDELEPRDDV